MSANTALAVYSKVQDPIVFVEKMAEAYGAMVGSQSKQASMAVAMQCLCEGITPMEFQAKYHLIMGKPSKKAIAMLDDFANIHGGTYEIKTTTPLECTIIFKNKEGREYTETFTRRDMLLSRWPWEKSPGWKSCVAEVRDRLAKGQPEDGVWALMSTKFKDNWGTELDWTTMLMNRRISTSLTYVCPAAKGGYYTPEEIQDIDAIEGEVLPPKAPPKTAADMLKNAVPGTAVMAAPVVATPVAESTDNSEAPFEDDGEVIEAEFELGGGAAVPEPSDTAKRLVARIIDGGNKAFGANWPIREANTFEKYKVHTWYGIPEQNLQEIADKVDAAVANSKN